MDIFKDDAIAAYGTTEALAEALGIGRTAVVMWSDSKPIPEKHALKLRYVLKPAYFSKLATQQDKTA